MKNSTIRTVAICFAALFLMGCAPEANEVCSKMEEVYKVSPAEAPGYLAVRKDCITSFENKRKRRGVNSYRRESECILAASRPYEVTQCMEKENERYN